MENLIVREFTLEDAPALLAINIKNKEYFEKWNPIKSDASSYSLDKYINKIRNMHEGSRKDEYYAFGVFLESSNTLIGSLSFAFVHRGPHQSSMLGYEIAEEYAGKGFGTRAVSLALVIAFNKLHFHRVTAEAQPENIASIRVLEKAGFIREGLLRKNLNVHGIWKDHVCMAILDEDL